MTIVGENRFNLAIRKSAQDHLNDLGPFTSLLRSIVTYSKKIGASDIHIEPCEKGIEFRVRVNGELQLYQQTSNELKESLLLEAKRIFGLSIGISGRPQDGRVSFPDLNLDLRVSLLPTYHGEKIVMRLLDLENSLDISKLGYTNEETAIFNEATNFEDGLVIISGPTGSGKTRALYSTLNLINLAKYNVVTIEDPIEYRLKGINQVQVTKKLGFSDALRSILRQDPDVILVGEIRDIETAKLCFQAASTGHLVFSTVHANGALEVIERLKQLSVSDLDLKSCLRFSLAQRLVQRICSDCSLPVDSLLYPNYEIVNPNFRTRNIYGCDNCRGGITGRLPILEWTRVNEIGEQQLFRSLEESKIKKAATGSIDATEVLE